MAGSTSSESVRERYDLEEPTLMDRLRENWIGYVFIAPVFIMFVGLFYIPILRGIWMSFMNYSLGGGGTFVGLENYRWVLTNDLFVYSVGWTLVFVFTTTLLQLGVGLIAALLLHELQDRWRDWGSAIIMSPYFAAPLASGVIWLWFLHPEFGALTRAFIELGLDPIAFLSTGIWPFVSLIVAQTWHDYAYAAIIYGAALQSIPREQYEAAAISGANRLRRFRDITLPHLLIPTIVILSIRTAYNISEFAQPFELTGGGPGTKTTLLSILTYQVAYVNLNFSRAYVIGLAMMVISMTAAIFYVVAIREEEDLYI
ncbi:MAG: carbohydrate ABC transporter permease [Haloplanus sp.]